MFVAGLILVAEETVRAEPRDAILLIGLGLMGLPTATVADRVLPPRRGARHTTQEDDS